jgi:hypothetical protein
MKNKFMNIHECFVSWIIHEHRNSYECSSFLKHHECPIISLLHLHELFMNVLWINSESYSWNIHEHSRIYGIHDQFMNIEIHKCSSFLRHHELSNNKFIAPSWTICLNNLWMNYESYSWSIHEHSRIHRIHEHRNSWTFIFIATSWIVQY